MPLAQTIILYSRQIFVDHISEPPSNGLRISRRERAAPEGVEIARISRAKRSVACACSALVDEGYLTVAVATAMHLAYLK